MYYTYTLFSISKVYLPRSFLYAFTNCFHIFWQVPYQSSHLRSSTSRACGPEMKRCHDYFEGFWRECSHKNAALPHEHTFFTHFFWWIWEGLGSYLCFIRETWGHIVRKRKLPKRLSTWLSKMVKWLCQILGLRFLSRHHGPLMNWIRKDSWYPTACSSSASGGYRWHWTS